MSNPGPYCSGGGGCDHNHQHDSPELGLEYSLYSKINLDHLTCLNELVDGSAKHVFKAWDERLNFSSFVESDCDSELVFNIPFNGSVKLKGIILLGPDDETHPNGMRLYKNKVNMTFDDMAGDADQEFHLVRDPNGLIEYPLKPLYFSSIHHLTIHIPSNFGDHGSSTRIDYIGLRGEWLEAARQEIPIASYELRPNLADHPNRIWNQKGQHNVGF